jgi:hypothetical protein
MIKHIVFIRLKDIYSSSERIDIIKEIELRLNELPQYINEIIKLETGINFNVKASAFDLSLSVDFDTKDDLQKYQVHPKHKEVLSYLGSLDIEVAVVDYII